MKKDKSKLIDAIDSSSIKRNDSGDGVSATIMDDFLESVIGVNHEKCDFKCGDEVFKTTYEMGDCHNAGTVGIVKGTIYDEKLGQAYFVLFGNDEALTLTIRRKIELKK